MIDALQHKNTSDWIIPLYYTPALPCHYTPCKTHPTGLYPWIIPQPCLALHTLQNISDWIIPLDYTPASPCHYTPRKTHPTGLYPYLALPYTPCETYLTGFYPCIIPLPCLAIHTDTTKTTMATLKCCYALHSNVGTIFSHDNLFAQQPLLSRNGDKSSEDSVWMPK